MTWTWAPHPCLTGKQLAIDPDLLTDDMKFKPESGKYVSRAAALYPKELNL